MRGPGKRIQNAVSPAVVLFNPERVYLSSLLSSPITWPVVGSRNTALASGSDAKSNIFAAPQTKLYQKLANGVKDHELLLDTDEAKLPTSCSRDGRFLLCQMFNPTTQTRSLWVLPLEGEKKPVPFALTPFNNSEGQFSPDGRLVAYVSDESGRDEIYVRTFSLDSSGVTSDDDGKWIISTGGGAEPRWSADGKNFILHGSRRALNGRPDYSEPTFSRRNAQSAVPDA
jgi:hypothetical protein